MFDGVAGAYTVLFLNPTLTAVPDATVSAVLGAIATDASTNEIVKYTL